MVSHRDRQRQLERERQQRAAQRRAQAAERRRKRNAVLGVVVAVVLIMGVVAAIALSGGSDPVTPGEQPTGTAAPTTYDDPRDRPVACDGEFPEQPQLQQWDEPADTGVDPDGDYVATLVTDCGDIEIALEAQAAPETVNSWRFLAGHDYYDGTICHRLTDIEQGVNDRPITLKVLQCGDPRGDGMGDPGYRLEEENTEGATYERGVVAMAKGNEDDTTGSQFFLVYEDTMLPPDYTVVGRITDGLDVLDELVSVGTANGSEDANPAEFIVLRDVTVTDAAGEQWRPAETATPTASSSPTTTTAATEDATTAAPADED